MNAEEFHRIQSQFNDENNEINIDYIILQLYVYIDRTIIITMLNITKIIEFKEIYVKSIWYDIVT